MSDSPTSSPQNGRSNRGTVVLLIGAIIGVLAVGGWQIWRQNQPDPWDDVPATGNMGLFYMPADFEPQEAVFLAGEPMVEQDPELLGEIIRSIAPHVDVTLFAGSAQGIQELQSFATANGLDGLPFQSRILPVTTIWVRDFGPMTVSDSLGMRSMVEFRGKLRRGRGRDYGLSTQLPIELGLAAVGHDLQVEGGDLLTNGRGLGLMSEQVLEANANFRGKDAAGIARTVAALLGMETIKVVPYLVGASSGHVNLFCAFLAPDLVVVASCPGNADAENADLLDGIAKNLKGFPTVDGPLQVKRIKHLGRDEGVWRSYTSIVFANEVVLVPIYPDHSPDLDQQALAQYRELLPDRNIIGVAASGLAQRNGTLRDVILNLPVGGPLEIQK